MTLDIFNNEKMKSTLKENVLELGNLNVEIVTENRSDILFRMTRVLEQRLVVYLEQTKMKLRDYSRHHNVRSSLGEVNAILRRLKQAAGYSEPYTDDEEEEQSQEKEVDKILQRFKNMLIFFFKSFTLFLFFICFNNSISLLIGSICQFIRYCNVCVYIWIHVYLGNVCRFDPLKLSFNCILSQPQPCTA